MKRFNVVHSLATKARTCSHVKQHLSGMQEEFWPDALPDGTNDSHGRPQDSNLGSLDKSHNHSAIILSDKYGLNIYITEHYNGSRQLSFYISQQREGLSMHQHM